MAKTVPHVVGDAADEGIAAPVVRPESLAVADNDTTGASVEVHADCRSLSSDPGSRDKDEPDLTLPHPASVCEVPCRSDSGSARRDQRPCPSCAFKNPASSDRCLICQTRLRGDAWRCPSCRHVVGAPFATCNFCGCERPEDTLEGRPVTASAARIEERVEVLSDWPLFPEAVGWLESVCGCDIDLSEVKGMDAVADVAGLEGEIWPYERSEEGTVLDVGDVVRTKDHDARMAHQRCGWFKDMAVFCGHEGTIERMLVNEDRAQVLLAFKDAQLDPSLAVSGRRDLCWFDFEFITCLPGTRLPTPPGGWYEKRQRFPYTVGDSVRVQAFSPEMERMRCGWDPSTKDTAGRVGVVLRILVTATAAQAQLSFRAAGTSQPWKTVWWDIEWLDIPPYRVAPQHAAITTGLCSGFARIRASSVRKCPRHHVCRWVANPYQGHGSDVECEGCGCHTKDVEVLHCAFCDFDLCKDCAGDAKVLDRAKTAIKAMSTVIRVGDVPEPWLAPIAKRLQQSEYGRVSLRRCTLKDGRAALHACIMGDINYAATVLEGNILCHVHDETLTAAGNPVANPVASVDQSILAAIERSFHCAVITPPTSPLVHQGTVVLLGPVGERAKAAGKLVWYSSARRVMLRVHPAERGVVQRKVAEFREKAKCHVSLDHGALIKIIGLPNAVNATRIAIESLLRTHRSELQRARVEKAMTHVVSELCEVRVAIPITPALKKVLSQLHEPSDNATSVGSNRLAAREASERAEQQVRQVRHRVHEELTELLRTATEDLQAVGAKGQLTYPSNTAGMRAFHVGNRVVRGPDWTWEDQDGGSGQVGRVFDFPLRYEMTEGGLVDGWVAVEWPNRSRFNYRIGQQQEVVHATEEGERLADEGNYAEEIPQRLVQHKQAYVYLVNAVGTLEVQQAGLTSSDSTERDTRRDTLQQCLHQATRDKARVEHAVQGCAASIAREEERAAQTLKRVTASLEDDTYSPQVTVGREASPPFTQSQLQNTSDLLTQHLENLRSLRARMHRRTDTVSVQLTSKAAKLRRELEEEIKRQRFSGWDIILSIMQETGALIEYKSGDDKLVLTGGEAAVHGARCKLRSLTLKDLYMWSRASGHVVVPPAAFQQVTRLQSLLARVVEQMSGAEAVRAEAPNRVVMEGTQPHIEKAADVLATRLGLGTLEIVWTSEPETCRHTESLVCDAVTVNFHSECDVCGDELTSENTLPMLCGHTGTCAQCLRMWVDTKVAERRPATCTNTDCKRSLTAGEYRKLVGMTGGSERSLDYELIMAKEKLRPHVRQCPMCDEGFAVRWEDGAMIPIACADCEALVCPNGSCAERAHYFLDCDEVVPRRKAMLLRRRERLATKGQSDEVAKLDRVLQHLEEAARTEEVLREEMNADGETRPCPACGALVHKTGGCYSMTCNCGQKFCHRCLQTTCELVEVTGIKVECDPTHLQDRIDTALAAHEGNAIFETWACCDVCDKYPIDLSKKVYSCCNCVNWYVCEDCEPDITEQDHPLDHLLVEVGRVSEAAFVSTDPPAPGPGYDIDWANILQASGELTTSASFETASPTKDSATGDTKPAQSVSVTIEPITPVNSSLEPPVDSVYDALEPPMLGGMRMLAQLDPHANAMEEGGEAFFGAA